MFNSSLNNFSATNILKSGANLIDKTFKDVPFFTNPFAPKAAPSPTYKAPSSRPSGASKNPSSSANSYGDIMAGLQAQLNSLQNYQPPALRVAQFDSLANYNNAKRTATAAVTPLYNKKLNLFLEGQGIKKDTKTKESNLSRENSNIALQNALGDSSTSRVRTGQDLANVLAAIGQGRDNFLVDDAQQFDQARRGLMEETAAAGGTDTGLGQQAIGQQQSDRNRASERQITEFQNQEAAKQLLATRTIDDLATSDTRSKQKKGQEDKATQLDFDSYMKSLANDEKSFRVSNDLEKALAIAQQTQTYDKEGTTRFIAGLANQGYSGEEIALAKQIYG